MRLGPRRDTIGWITFVASGVMFFAMGMVIGRGVFGPNATKPLLFASGIAMVTLVHGVLWGTCYFLRRFYTDPNSPIMDEPGS